MTNKANILVADDDECYGNFVAAVARRLGYSCRVDRAKNGAEAIERIKERCDDGMFLYDIVITDINMPAINGLDLTKHIRSHERKKDITVIIMSSQDARDVEKIAYDAGADIFIQKTGKIKEVEDALIRAISIAAITKGKTIARRTDQKK
ncbi:response regulator [Magnetospirillum sp. ME-1]|uniref:response regulator n=1 Tax=Magnetospirillum sp. ME-1 TaxID=1639348 RepID=UPI000A18B424|nr:response regulator [Magnetospirillum sp. ME-1]